MTVNDVLDGHVGLDMECLDRIYLNGYVPNLQVGGQVVSFHDRASGYPIPSPAILEKIGTAFRKAVDRFADDNHIPVVRFGKDDRKIDVMRPYLAAPGATGRSGGGRDRAGAGVREGVRRAPARRRATAVPWFSLHQGRPAGHAVIYFYLWDADFGPAFFEVLLLLPVPDQVWVNGHEWAKRQAAKAGIGFTELYNGFATVDDPGGAAGDLRPARARRDRRAASQAGWPILPLPFTAADRAAGYWYELSMRQVEFSLHPGARRTAARAGCSSRQLIRDNLDIGRPDQVELIFDRRLSGADARPTRAVPDPGHHLRGHAEPARRLQAHPHQAVPQLRREVARDE